MLRPTDEARVELPSFWRPGDFRLFITHLTDRARFVLSLKKALSPYHITCFVAHKDIRPAEDWNAEVLLALQTTHGLLALLHEDFHDSEWTDQEVGIALGRGVFVLAVMLGEEPKGFLGRAHALDGRGKSPRALAGEIFRLLNSQSRTRRLIAEALLCGFEVSGDRHEAIDNMTLLEQMDDWDPQQTPERLRRAVQSNPWIAKAWRIPERVEDLIHRRTMTRVER